MTLRLLRLGAILVAVAGVVDPASTVSRPVKPTVRLVASPSLPDPALPDRVAASLASAFTVVRDDVSPAAAVVSVGDQLPSDASDVAMPAFAVLPEARAPFVAIDSVRAPPAAQLHSRIPVSLRMRVAAAQGRKLTVSLRSDGVVLDQTTHDLDRSAAVLDATLSFVASTEGTAQLRVTAVITGATRPAHADFGVRVEDRRWAVLSFDVRPSWTATFIRRALESDARFLVTSRVRTTPGGAMTAGAAPSTLSSLPALEVFDVIVVGAAQALADADARGLETFMRERGGAVVLLLDEPPGQAGGRSALLRLTGVSQWHTAAVAEPTGNPPGSESVTPAVAPSWAETEASPTIWRTAVGRGRLIISGALDAWRYRHLNDGEFDRFWTAQVAEAADATLATVPASSRAPRGAAGAQFDRPTPDERSLIEVWTASRGGHSVVESELATLAPAIARVLEPPHAPHTFHPMRSAWWLAPFCLLLGGEWWLRRRAGLR